MIVAAVLLATAVAQSATHADLQWLAGNWLACEGDVAIRQSWIPDNSSMFGVMRVDANDVEQSVEIARIDTRDGVTQLALTDQGGRTERFALTSTTRFGAVFEDRNDQYTRSIRYRLVDGDLQITRRAMVGEAAPDVVTLFTPSGERGDSVCP